MSNDEETYIAPEAYIHPTALIGRGVKVHPFAYLGENVEVGARTILGPGCVLLPGTRVGEDCVIAAEAVLGSRGFGYVFDGTQHLRIPQVGSVDIGDRTEIGPATCIDRATLDSTSIGQDCKLGALVQVAHNCQVAQNCHIDSGSGLAGSTHIAAGARFGKRVGTVGHSHYGEGVIAQDMAGITKTRVPAGSHWAGHPARQVK